MLTTQQKLFSSHVDGAAISYVQFKTRSAFICPAAVSYKFHACGQQVADVYALYIASSRTVDTNGWKIRDDQCPSSQRDFRTRCESGLGRGRSSGKMRFEVKQWRRTGVQGVNGHVVSEQFDV